LAGSSFFVESTKVLIRRIVLAAGLTEEDRGITQVRTYVVHRPRRISTTLTVFIYVSKKVLKHFSIEMGTCSATSHGILHFR